MVAGPEFWACRVKPDDLRPIEKEIIQVPSFNQNYQYLAIYDLRYITQKEAQYSILTTLIVCAVFIISSLVLTNTNNDLLIHPIEIMVKKV